MCYLCRSKARLDKNGLRVLTVLVSHSSHKVFPIQLLSDQLSLSEKCVRAKIQVLRELGCIETSRSYPGIPYKFRVLDTAHDILAQYVR